MPCRSRISHGIEDVIHDVESLIAKVSMIGYHSLPVLYRAGCHATSLRTSGGGLVGEIAVSVYIAIFCCTLGAAAFSLTTYHTNGISLPRTKPLSHSSSRPLVNWRMNLVVLGGGLLQRASYRDVFNGLSKREFVATY